MSQGGIFLMSSPGACCPSLFLEVAVLSSFFLVTPQVMQEGWFSDKLPSSVSCTATWTCCLLGQQHEPLGASFSPIVRFLCLFPDLLAWDSVSASISLVWPLSSLASHSLCWIRLKWSLKIVPLMAPALQPSLSSWLEGGQTDSAHKPVSESWDKVAKTACEGWEEALLPGQRISGPVTLQKRFSLLKGTSWTKESFGLKE